MQFSRKARALLFGTAASVSVMLGRAHGAESPAINLIASPPVTTLTSTGYSIGFEFTATMPITMSSFGVFDHGGDGFAEPHSVALYSGDSISPSQIETVSNADPLSADGFRYHPTQPFTYFAGNRFTIVAYYSNGSLDAVASPASPSGFSAGPVLTLGRGRYLADAPGPRNISWQYSAEAWLFGPNFRYTYGGDTWINSAGGTWSDGTNWNSSGAPRPVDPAIFDRSSSSGYTVTIAAPAQASTLSIRNDNVSFDLGSSTLTVNEFHAGESNTLAQPTSAFTTIYGDDTASLNAGTMSVGQQNAIAILSHNSANVRVTNDLVVYGRSQLARYELNGGTLSVGHDLQLLGGALNQNGAAIVVSHDLLADGALNHNGGALNVLGKVQIGDVNSSGTLTMAATISGPTLTSQDIALGGGTTNRGARLTIPSGATVIATNKITSVGSRSQIVLSGGTLSVGAINVGNLVSTFANNWSSGTLNFRNSTAYNFTNGISQSLGLASGKAMTVDGDLQFGETNLASLINTGGLLRVSKSLGMIGTGFTNAGTFTIGEDFAVGSVGPSLFTVAGGTINVGRTLYVGKTNASNGTIVLNGGAVTAASCVLGFGGNIGTVTVNTGGSLNVAGTTSLLTAGSRLFLNGGSFSTDTLNVSAGTVTMKSGINNVLRARVVSTQGNGVIDLADNDMHVTGGSTYNDISAQIARAYHFGDWDQPGITSSVAAAAGNTTLGLLTGQEYLDNNGAPSFNGANVNAGDVLVKYTYFGDVDFNGQLDASDYNLIDFGFTNHLTGWANGDADYSGSVDVSDYNLIDFAFTTQNGTVLRAIAYLDGTDRSTRGMNDDPSLIEVTQHFAQFGKTYASGFLATVPEPTSLLSTLSFCSLLRRRRRQ